MKMKTRLFIVVLCLGVLGCGRGLQIANVALDRADQIDNGVVHDLTEIARVNATDLAAARIKEGQDPKLVLGQYGNILTDIMNANVEHAHAGEARSDARIYLDSTKPLWFLLMQDLKTARDKTTTQPAATGT